VLLFGIGLAGLVVFIAAGYWLGGVWQRRASAPRTRLRPSPSSLLPLLRYVVIVAVGVAVSFGIICLLGKVADIHGLRTAEHHAHKWVADRRAHDLTSFSSNATAIGDIWVSFWEAVALGVLIAVFQRRLRPLILLVLAVPVEVRLQQQFKKVVDLPPKPDPSISIGPHGGFPSGGTARILIVAGLAALFILPAVAPAARRWLVALVATLTYVELFTRVELGRHWVSDIVGGLVFGGGLLLSVMVAEEHLITLSNRPNTESEKWFGQSGDSP
jgi:membrane-associated phospholipid phosphatase